MKRIQPLLLVLLATLAPFASVTVRGAAPADLQRLLPFTDEFTVVAARLDLGRIDTSAWAAAVLDLLPEQRPAMAGPVDQAKQAVQAWLDEFRKAGGEVVYLIVSLSDLGLEPPVAVVIPLADGSDAARLGALSKQSGILAGLNSAVLHGCLVVATDPVLERVKARAPHTPRQLESAYAAAPSGVLQAALLPYEDAGRVIEELMPLLPASLGGGSSSTLSRGLLWATLSLQPPPEWALELAVLSRTAAEAAALED